MVGVCDCVRSGMMWSNSRTRKPAHTLHQQYWGGGGGESSLNTFILTPTFPHSTLSYFPSLITRILTHSFLLPLKINQPLQTHNSNHSHFPSLNPLTLTAFIPTPTFPHSTLTYSHTHSCSHLKSINPCILTILITHIFTHSTL